MKHIRPSSAFQNTTAKMSDRSGIQYFSRDIMPGMSATFFSIKSDAPTEIVVDNDCEYVHFSYIIKGKCQVNMPRCQTICEKQNLHAGFAPGERFTFKCSEQYESMELLVSPSLLQNLAGDGYHVLLRDIQNGFFVWSKPSLPNLRIAAGSLYNRLISSPGKIILSQASALEYLGQYLDCSETMTSEKIIGQRLYRKLSHAQDLLLADKDLCIISALRASDFLVG